LRVLSGIQPSGRLHIGNFFGAMRQHLQLQGEHDCFYFIADYHALTSNPAPAEVAGYALDVTLDYLALGLDTEKTVFWRQSDVPEVTELTWLLSCVTPMGLLQRCTSYKEKIAQGVAVVPGLDGQKMSKSYGNTIEIFEPEKSVRKKIMRIVTDSTPVEEPKEPENCNVFALLKLVASEEELAEWENRYRSGGLGYGQVKERLAELMVDYFRPFRDKRAELENNIDYVKEVLTNGAERAKAVASKTLARARKAVGLGA